MEKKTEVQLLIELCRVDIDAAKLYETAVRNVEVYEIRERVSAILSDHYRHISELSSLIEKMDGLAPVNAPFAPVRLLHPVSDRERTADSLRDMRDNERIINRIYSETLAMGLAPDVLAAVERCSSDERRHLEYLEETVREKSWEKVPVPPVI